MAIQFTESPGEFYDKLLEQAIESINVWIVIRSSQSRVDDRVALETTLDSLHYQLCNSETIGLDTTVWRYSWKELECQSQTTPAVFSNKMLNYHRHYAELNSSISKITIVDEWIWRADLDVAFDSFQMSYQLISPDWENVAQLDLPLIHEGMPRRFSIDVSDVPSGSYRLMAILYDKDTGERESWSDHEGFAPDLLTLAEVVLQ